MKNQRVKDRKIKDRKKLALIHIIKRELNLSDSEYRNILQQAAGVRSAKDLNKEKFRKLMNYFVRSKHYRINHYGLTIKQKFYIKSLAHEMGWDEGHLSNFIHKYYHTFDIDTLTKHEAIKVIESLKKVKQHQT
ncbi:MAG: phage protein GemA/Gp16 family protein [bacterium]